jgi:hypothetical protein
MNQGVVAYEYENERYFDGLVTIEEFGIELVQENLDLVQMVEVVVVYDDDDVDEHENDDDNDHLNAENWLVLLF